MPFIQEQTIESRSFLCGFCSHLVASSRGYYNHLQARIYVCPHCERPTFFDIDNSQMPDVAPGNPVADVPDDVEALYNEARKCVSVSAYTASVLACRKLLMNIGVSQGAKEGKSFVFYVEYLSNNGYIPPNGKGWVDSIRAKGNEATHEINPVGREDAVQLIKFIEMLLKFIYEFPAQAPAAT